METKLFLPNLLLKRLDQGVFIFNSILCAIKIRISSRKLLSLCTLLIIFAAMGSSLVEAYTIPANNRVNENFNANWKYTQSNPSGADAKSFNDASWTTVGVPHSTKYVTANDPNALLGVSWYRKHFTVKTSLQGRKIFIEFEAAMQVADVWVNGTLKIHHEGGYTPFTIDITNDVAYGTTDNVVAIKIDNNPNPNWAPGKLDIDFQYHGGLYRDVKIYATDKLHVTDAVYANKVAGGGVFVTYPVVSTGSATINIKTNILNENTSSKNCTVLSQITDANDNIVQTASTAFTISSSGDHTYEQNITIASPNLWHPNTPYLYKLRTIVSDGGTVVDYYETPIGIRRIQWTHNNGLLINGSRFYAMGTNIHQDIFGLGNAMSNTTIYYDVKRMKDAGFDFVRGCHYPHDPAFYEACDKLGVLVMNCLTGWQNFNDTDPFKNNTYKECRDMIRRDRNHPSIIAWETSLNESGYTTAWAQTIHNYAHADFPGDQMYTSGWLKSVFDIYSESSQGGVRDYGTNTETRPTIICEYGHWDYGGNNSTSNEDRESSDNNLLTQCNNHQDGFNKNLAVSWFSADGVWVFADYSGFGSNATTLYAGVMDYYRLPKFSYYFYRSQRAQFVQQSSGISSGPMVFIANTWQANSPTSVRVFSNCDQVSLYLNGTLIETRTPDTNYPHIWHPPFTFNLNRFTAGTLRADGIVGGKIVTSYTRITPGNASKIVLTPEGSDQLTADGGDSRLVYISVVDGNGTIIPTANNQINLSVSGAGKLIGPTVITLKGGQLAAWIQAGTSAGNITLTASGSGLTSASVTLSSKDNPLLIENGSGIVAGTYSIVNRNSAKALCPLANSTADGVNIVQVPVNSNSTFQQWVLTDIGGGYWTIKNVASGKLMDIKGASLQDTALNIQWPSNNGLNQNWQILAVDNGYYKIVNQNSGKNLDIMGASLADNALDIQWPNNNGYNQHWSFSRLKSASVTEALSEGNVNANAIIIYPNPLSGGKQLIIEGLSGTSNIRVIDIKGRIVKEIVVNEQREQLEMNLKSGIYILKIVNAEQSSTMKLVIQ